jgi:serine/threonine protein kinase
MEIPGYLIERQIGQGGMATAYLAEQISLGRRVVLKVLDSKVRVTTAVVERFLNEGRLIASLNHPHIITIYDIGQSDDDVFISMEYVEGGDLKERMQQLVFAPVEAVDVIAKIASGLAAAHKNGIVHRDVKPGNILFRSDGTPLLSDFGIAKRLSGNSDLTQTGMFLGSPNYMAPEQSEDGALDGRADIYVLGVIFYEMLSGQRAYLADSVIDVIVMHKKAPIPQLPLGLEHFQVLLNLMMAKDRKERFRDAPALLHFIAEMRRSGAIKSKEQMTANPDIDITGEHLSTVVPEPPVTRVALVQRKLAMPQVLMIGLLGLCLLGWATLLTIERQMRKPSAPHVQVAVTLDSVSNDTILNLSPLGATPTPGESLQVAQALLWLAHHSLDEFRLTAPPRDNAYYYFSRLLHIDSGNVDAAVGLRKVAAQYAFLAEREIAHDRVDAAISFIRIGLQIDPQNDTLRTLAELARNPKVGFWSAITSFFE